MSWQHALNFISHPQFWHASSHCSAIVTLTSDNPPLLGVLALDLPSLTGKNNLTRCVTHRTAVSATMIHSIFDAWHYEFLWTCALTSPLWYAFDYVRSILYIMLHSTKLPNALHSTLPSKLSRYSQTHSRPRSQVHSQLHLMTLHACLTIHSQVSSQDPLKHTPEYALNYTLNCTRWHSQPAWLYAPKYTPSMLPSTPTSRFSSTLPGILSSTLPIALDGTLPACLTVHSQVNSQDAHKQTPQHAPKYTLKRQDTPNLTWLYAPMYAPGCSIHRLIEWQAPVTGRRVAGGDWWALFGGQHVACGVCQIAGGVWWPNHDVGRYHTLNPIFSSATVTRSHNASCSWCWQL